MLTSLPHSPSDCQALSASGGGGGARIFIAGMLPTITIMSHLSDESVLATGAERVGKSATAPK
jgi:hypothetical protein